MVFENIDEEVLSELRGLNQSSGIGVTKLESETLDSKILLGSKEREIDVETLNMFLQKIVILKNLSKISISRWTQDPT